MRLLVSDTSVLIDLERGGLLETAFRLSWEFAVPDLLYKRELRDHNGPALLHLGLRVGRLTKAGCVKRSHIRSGSLPFRCRTPLRSRWRK